MAYSTASTTSHKQRSQSAFANALDQSIGSNKLLCNGENGSDMYTLEGLSSDGSHPIQAALVGIFSGIVDDSQDPSVINYVKSVLCKIEEADELTPALRANFASDLIVSAVHVRNIRDNGKGRRDQSRAMFIELLNHYPDTMISLLPVWIDHGCWRDCNTLLEIFSCPKFAYNKDIQRLLNKIYDMYATQIKDDSSVYKQWCKDKAAAEDYGLPFTKKCNITGAAKWVPKEKRSLDKKYKVVSRLAETMFPETYARDKYKAVAEFRRIRAPLMDAISVTEKLMCARKADEIQFNFVPGKCFQKLKKAFLYEDTKGVIRGTDEVRLQCRTNLQEHLQNAVTGEGGAKINATTLYLHELCGQVCNNWDTLTDDDRNAYNAQFKSHEDHFRKLMTDGLEIGNGIVLADFSGSMSGDPMNAAMALAILVSTLATGPFKDMFLTFETTPHMISLRYPKTLREFNTIINFHSGYNNILTVSNLHPLGIWDPNRAGGGLTFVEKCGICYTSPWGGFTDFIAVHDLLLDVAYTNNLDADDFPTWFIVASDMQFDIANKSGINNYPIINSLVGSDKMQKYTPSTIEPPNPWGDHHSILESAYNKAGFTMPRMIYWNMRATNSFVVQAGRIGVEMLGGFSTMMLKLFLEEGETDTNKNKEPEITPWETLQRAYTNKCYDNVRRVIANVGEKCFKDYVPVITSDDRSDMSTARPSSPVSFSNADIIEEVSDESPNSMKCSGDSGEKPLYIDNLRQLKLIYDEGLITKDDYDNQKNKILSRIF